MPGFSVSTVVNSAVSGIKAGGYVLRQAVVPNGIGLGTALSVGLTALDISQRRRENPKMSLTEAVARTALDLVLWKVATPVMLGVTVGSLLYNAGVAIGKRAFTYRPMPGERPGNAIGRGFFDNAAKATARRRAVAAMQESKMAINYALGSEARRISRGYFDSF